MSSRKKTDQRCGVCLMRKELCICSLVPRLDIATELILLVHRRELKRPTNTGRLAAQALPNSQVIAWGDQDAAEGLVDFSQLKGSSLLLYPAEDAIVLSPEFCARLPRPVHLIVPDGNWRQTFKMRRRIPGLSKLQTVVLPLGMPSSYEVRRETKSGGLATIEAIARSLGMLEGSAIQKSLEQLLAVMVQRTLSSRGQAET